MKRLVVCCDGTWNAPEKLELEERIATNVLKMSRAVLPRDTTGIVQIVEYVRGIGTKNLVDRLVGGASGKGITSNILQAYQFISNNFERGDQIFLFGFSRGAYTARSLSGFIDAFGILKKCHQDSLPTIYDRYQRLSKLSDMVDKYRWMSDLDLEDERGYIPVHFLGVWDTVGALGVPLTLIRRIVRKRIDFHNTELARNVTSAYHALAIHEFRKHFPPTLWTFRHSHQTVEQVWFPGAHSDVGGGGRETGLPNVALQWMAGRAALAGLALDKAYLVQMSPKSLVPISKSRIGVYSLSAARVRPIGPKYNPKSLCEFKHKAVEDRLSRLSGTIAANRSKHELEADHRSADPSLPVAPKPKYL